MWSNVCRSETVRGSNPKPISSARSWNEMLYESTRPTTYLWNIDPTALNIDQSTASTLRERFLGQWQVWFVFVCYTTSCRSSGTVYDTRQNFHPA